MPVSENARIAAIGGLVPAANLWAEGGRAKAKTERIRRAIKVGQVVDDGGGRFHIDISISLKDAPEALAYEFGSGLEGRQHAKYRIEPKTASALAFEWSPVFDPWGSPKFIGKTAGGKYLFRYVEHPGVKPEPYMKPALDENKAEMRRLIGRQFSVEMIGKAIREMFTID